MIDYELKEEEYHFRMESEMKEVCEMFDHMLKKFGLPFEQAQDENEKMEELDDDGIPV